MKIPNILVDIEEIIKGFNTIKKYDTLITVFGSARYNVTNKYYKAAFILGEKLANENIGVVQGGGPAIMEASAAGCCNSGGTVLSMDIDLPMEQYSHPYYTENVEFKRFYTRKRFLVVGSQAFVVFPGGFGTLDELFEVLCLIQTGKFAKVPVILYGSEFWKGLDVWLNSMLTNEKVIDEKDTSLYEITDDIDYIVKRIITDGYKETKNIL